MNWKKNCRNIKLYMTDLFIGYIFFRIIEWFILEIYTDGR